MAIISDTQLPEELTNKLRFVPKEVIVGLARNLFIGYEEELKQLIKDRLECDVRKPLVFLGKCDRETLIKLLSYRTKLPEDKINKLYEEYLYGKNPLIFLFQVYKPKPLSVAKLKEVLVKEFFELNQKLIQQKETIEKDFQIDSIKTEGSIIEVIFSFSLRVDYIDRTTNKPKFVYHKETGIIWLPSSFKSMIIKAKDWYTADVIRKITKKALNSNIYSFSLNQKLIDSIIDPKTVKSGRFKKLFPKEDEVEAKTITDERLLSKSEGIKTNKEYDRKSSRHKLDVSDTPASVSIYEHGKLYIRKHVRKSDLRGWAFELLHKIIEKLNALKNKDYSDYIKSVDSKHIKALESETYPRRALLVELSKILGDFFAKNEAVASTDFTISDVFRDLDKYTYFFIDSFCNECDSTKLICDNCGSSEFEFTKTSFSLACKHCGKNIDGFPEGIKCENGHKIEGSLADNVVGILSPQGKQKLNDLFSELEINIKLTENDVVTFKNKSVQHKRISEKTVYTIDEIPEFQKIPVLSDIKQDKRSTMLGTLKDTGEKCEYHSNENCRNCLIETLSTLPCIQRVIASFCNGEVHSHSGHEYGDFSFQTTLEGSSIRFACLVKRYEEKTIKGVLQRKDFTMQNNKGIFNQAWAALSRDSIAAIGIVTGGHIDQELKEAIITIAKSKNKKVLFIGPEELVRVYSKYDWSEGKPNFSL